MPPSDHIAGQVAEPQVDTPPVSPDLAEDIIDIIVEGAIRPTLIDQLKEISDRVVSRGQRVAEAMRCFQGVMQRSAAASTEKPNAAFEERAAVADALLGVCQAVRDGEFSRGYEQILNSDRADGPKNVRLAIRLYRLGWTGDRQAVLDYLDMLRRLPGYGDNFDETAPSQLRVMDELLEMFDLILFWPHIGTFRSSHPDMEEATRIQAELLPPPPQEVETEPVSLQPRIDSLSQASVEVQAPLTAGEGDHRTAQEKTEEPHPAANPETQYVTLDKAAALVSRCKKTLERLLNRKTNPMPSPDVEGGGGKPHEWLWSRIRPWLEKEFGRKLPLEYPSLRR